MTSAEKRSELRVAVVGFGSIGHRHFDNLRALGVRHVCVVRRPSGANPAFTPPAGTPVVHSPQAALEDGVDVAIICNPTSLHVPTARTFVSEGVAVLIEKPVAEHLEAALDLVELAEGQKVTAGVAYCLRYHPAYAAARGAVVSGQIGRVLYAKAWFESYLPDWHPWEDYRQSYAARSELGGGALRTLDHEIDFLNWCLGTPLSAECQTLRSGVLETDVDDLAFITLRYGRGVRATVQLSMCRRDHSRGFELVGESGTLSFRFDTGQLLLCSGADAEVETLWDGAGYELGTMYREMLADFLDAVVDGRRPPVPLAAGIDTLRVSATAALVDLSEEG